MSIAPLLVGNPAPSAQLCDISGQLVELEESWRARPLLIFFLRHLGCALCRAHVRQIADAYPQLTAEGADVIAVTFADAASAAFLQYTQRLPFSVLVDESRSVYHAYGMLEGNIVESINPRILIQQVRQIPLGQVPSVSFNTNLRQLGGSVIIDTDGIVQFYHLGQPIDSYPSISQYVGVFKQIRAAETT